MPAESIRSQVLFDATQGYSFVETIHESNTSRHLNLMITPEGTGNRLKVQTLDEELRAALGDKVECRLPLTEEHLWGAVQECRGTWHSEVIDRRSASGDRIFQRYWDLAEVEHHLAAVLRPLAEAGAKLFLAISLPDFDDGASDIEVRRHIFNVLREHTADRPLWIRITAPRFFAPWNMIYCKKGD